MPLTAAMVAQAMPLWEESLQAPFLQEMAAGTLPTEKFKRYLIQDTLYLKGFSKAYAYGFINSEDIRIMRKFYENMNVIMADESLLHIRYLEGQYGMKEESVYDLPMEPENQAYVDFMVETAKTGTAVDTLAAVMPCILSYLYVGRKVKEAAQAQGTLEGNPYRLWIEEYSSAQYQASCDSVTAFMDEVSVDADAGQWERAKEIFSISSRHEQAFWDMAYRL